MATPKVRSSAVILVLVFLSFPAWSVSLTGAPLDELVRTVSQITGVEYKFSHEICERFNLQLPRDVTPAEARIALLDALAIHGLALIPIKGVATIKPSRFGARDEAGPPPPCEPMSLEFVTQVLRGRVHGIEEALGKDLKDSSITAVPGETSVVVTAPFARMRAVEKAVLLQSP